MHLDLPLGLFVGVIAARNLLEVLVRPRSRARTGDAGRRSLALLVAPFVVGGVATAGWLAAAHPLPWPWLAGGLGLVAAGFGGRWWALRAIAPSYSLMMTPCDDGRLVTAGPYRWIRHPIYAFYLLELAGLAVARPNPVAVACVVVVAAATVHRVRREDALLEARYGDPWRAWRATTRRLVPRIW